MNYYFYTIYLAIDTNDLDITFFTIAPENKPLEAHLCYSNFYCHMFVCTVFLLFSPMFRDTTYFQNRYNAVSEKQIH